MKPLRVNGSIVSSTPYWASEAADFLETDTVGKSRRVPVVLKDGTRGTGFAWKGSNRLEGKSLVRVCGGRWYVVKVNADQRTLGSY